MQNPDLIIFGCEGVLVDSELSIARSSARMLAAAGIELPVEEIAGRFAGHSFKDILLTLERETGRPLQASMIDRAESYINEQLQREARPTEGVLGAIAALEPRAVISNASRERLDILLKAAGLAPLFERAAFSREDTQDGRPKPAPDLLVHAAQAIGAEPAATFVVDSTAEGIKAAGAAGMRAIGYTGASHSFIGHADILSEAGAETVINRWSNLAPVLDALSQWRDG